MLLSLRVRAPERQASRRVVVAFAGSSAIFEGAGEDGAAGGDEAAGSMQAVFVEEALVDVAPRPNLQPSPMPISI